MKVIVSLCIAVMAAGFASFALAFDCPLGSAVIEPHEQFKNKFTFDSSTSPVVPIPVQSYQCVKFDKIHKKWIAYRGSKVFAFPADQVRVWRVDGELFVNANGQVLLRPRKPFLIKKNESLVGEIRDLIQYSEAEKEWKTQVRDLQSGVTEKGGAFPVDKYDAYDGNGLAIPVK